MASECRVDVLEPGTWPSISTEIDPVPLWNHQGVEHPTAPTVPVEKGGQSLSAEVPSA